MNRCEIVLTEHVIARTMERVNLNRRKAIRIITLAMERGRDIGSSESELRQYLKNKSKNNCIAKEYNGYCFIIDRANGTLVGVTMFPIPGKVLLGNHYDGKTRIRNAKKYARFHS